jgi:hypothetical protein
MKGRLRVKPREALETLKEERGTMNKRESVFTSSFIVPPSALL